MNRFFLLTLILASLPLYADPIITDRPDFTESAQTVPAGFLQLEGGITVQNSEDERNYSIGEKLIRVGILEAFEVRIGIPSYLSTPDNQGLSDPYIGFKQLWIEGKDFIPQTATIVSTYLPWGAQDIRRSGIEPEFKLCLGWQPESSISLSSNLNLNGIPDNDHLFIQFTPSLSIGKSWTETISTYLEWYAPFPDHAINTGITWLITPDFQADIRIGMGLNGTPNDYFLGTGLAWRTPL